MEQAGVEEFPGPLPAVNVVRHVTPMKSPPAAKAPSVVGESVEYFDKFDNYTFRFTIKIHTKYTSITELESIVDCLIISLPVAVLPG